MLEKIKNLVRGKAMLAVAALAVMAGMALVPQTVRADDTVIESATIHIEAAIHVVSTDGTTLTTPDAGTFHFSIYKRESSFSSKITGDPLSSADNDANGNVVFPDFTITLDDVVNNSFNYAIIEKSDLFESDGTYVVPSDGQNIVTSSVRVATTTNDDTAFTSDDFSTTEDLYQLTFNPITIRQLVQKKYVDDSGNTLDLTDGQFKFQRYHKDPQTGKEVIDYTSTNTTKSVSDLSWGTTTPNVDLGYFTLYPNMSSVFGQPTQYKVREVVPNSATNGVEDLKNGYTLTYYIGNKTSFTINVIPKSGLVPYSTYEKLIKEDENGLSYVDECYSKNLDYYKYNGATYTSLTSLINAGISVGDEYEEVYTCWGSVYNWKQTSTRTVTKILSKGGLMYKQTSLTVANHKKNAAREVCYSITNIRSPKTVQANIIARKKLVDKAGKSIDLQGNDFEFKIQPVQGDRYEDIAADRLNSYIVSNDENGLIDFGSITFSTEDVENYDSLCLYYEIVEGGSRFDFVRYDDTVINFAVYPYLRDGELYLEWKSWPDSATDEDDVIRGSTDPENPYYSA